MPQDDVFRRRAKKAGSQGRQIRCEEAPKEEICSSEKASRHKTQEIHTSQTAALTPELQSSRMPYLVLARKYRPQLFREVIGQDHVTHTLLNALTQRRIAHGYIFSGHRGIGKTTI